MSSNHVERPTANTLGALLGAGMLMSVATHDASAAVITQDGAQLQANGSVSFPSDAPTLSGTTLQFPASANLDTVLLRWDLFGPGTLNGASASADVQITANMGRVTSEWDVLIALWDGTNYVGGYVGDNFGGTYQGGTGTSDGASLTSFVNQGVSNPGGMWGIGASGDIGLGVTLGVASTDITLSGINGTFAYSTGAFDRTQALSLLIFRNDPNVEAYDVHSITVDSALFATSVPEPPMLVALTLAALVVAAVRVRRTTFRNAPVESRVKTCPLS